MVSLKKHLFPSLFFLTVSMWAQPGTAGAPAASLAGHRDAHPNGEPLGITGWGSLPPRFQGDTGRLGHRTVPWPSGAGGERGRLWQHYFCPPVWNGFLFISACVFSLLGIDTQKMKCSDMGSVRRTLLSRRHGLLTQTPLITSETGGRGGKKGGARGGGGGSWTPFPKSSQAIWGGKARGKLPLLGPSWGSGGLLNPPWSLGG